MIWNLFFMFGGVAAMMVGMKIMGGSLEKIAGGGMKKMLGKITSNRFAGVGVGIAVTSIIQSSTATTVMLVGFVNIGLMTLMQATHVIMGANIGTTVTAHIVSLSGVGGGVDIGAIAAMIGCIGILMAMLLKDAKIQNIGNILAGLGLIFVGLEFISTYAKLIMFNDGVPYSWVTAIFQGGHFPLLLVVIGIIITALVHSSSTITSLMVVLASIGVLSFDNALFLALGSNIGTCVTALLSSAGTQVNAKRTAVVHLLFNTLGCLIFLAPIWIFAGEITAFFASISGDVGQQIAIFHTMFNIITTIILLPVSTLIVKLVIKLVPERNAVEEDACHFMFIDERFLSTPAVAVSNTKNEIIRMAGFARENLENSMKILLDNQTSLKEKFVENENTINCLNRAITAFLTKLIHMDLTEKEDKKVGSYYRVVSDIERIGDYAENIVEYADKLSEESMSFSEHAKEELRNLTEKIYDLFDKSIAAFDDRNPDLLAEVESIEDNIDSISAELENYHIDRLKNGRCTAQVGSVYLQTVSHLERIGDHITNISASIKQYC